MNNEDVLLNMFDICKTMFTQFIEYMSSLAVPLLFHHANLVLSACLIIFQFLFSQFSQRSNCVVFFAFSNPSFLLLVLFLCLIKQISFLQSQSVKTCHSHELTTTHEDIRQMISLGRHYFEIRVVFLLRHPRLNQPIAL